MYWNWPSEFIGLRAFMGQKRKKIQKNHHRYTKRIGGKPLRNKANNENNRVRSSKEVARDAKGSIDSRS